MDPRPGELCLDLGCGTGAITRRLAALKLDVTGVDISPRSVERAQAAATTERYVVGDIRDTGLPAGGYDIICYSGILHHFDRREERITVLREGRRLLAPGGRLFAFDPNAHSPPMFLYRDPRSPLHSTEGKTENEVLLSRRQLEEEIRAAGFSTVETLGVSGVPFRFIAGPVARWGLPILNLYEWVLGRLPIQRQLGTFVISIAR